MRRTVAMLVALSAHPAFADESYEFYKINCTSIIPSFEITRGSYWNIGQAIWPHNHDWPKHIQALKQFERENNMYVFNEWYGYYDTPQVTFNCGDLHATIIFEKIYREEGPVGSKEPVRKNASISIFSNGRKIAQDLSIELISKISIYKDEGGLIFTEYCSGENCTEHYTENIEPLSNETFLRLREGSR